MGKSGQGHTMPEKQGQVPSLAFCSPEPRTSSPCPPTPNSCLIWALGQALAAHFPQRLSIIFGDSMRVCTEVNDGRICLPQTVRTSRLRQSKVHGCL